MTYRTPASTLRLAGALAAFYVTLVGQPSDARADVIYSNFTASHTYLNLGYSVAVGSTPEQLFTLSSAYTISNIILGLTQNTTYNAATVSVYSDIGNSNGVLLGSWGVAPTGVYGQTTSSLVQVATGGLGLAAGQYFLQVAASGNNYDVWNQNALGVSGHLFYNGSPSSSLDTAYELDGTPDLTAVPEPATIMLLAMGLFSIIAVRGSASKP